MKLSRLEVYGFKSFPERLDIRFNEGITGIVGPNGSGKSNLADAVRWVLGEQSAKALRGAKMEDVIFAGTQKRRLMPYCEVTLIFDNEDGSLKSPNPEVMVTRRAYRTGESEYRLNNKACRLKDIVSLFHDTGIGREGYSIIGQGHIDVILSGRGEERRAAFEEAAGIIGYRSRKEEAERKLNKTQEHLLRVNDLLEELGNRLGPLKEQSETAREYLALAERLKYLDANIFLQRNERLIKRMEGLKENQQALAQEIARHEGDLALYQGKRLKADEELSLAETESTRLGEALAALETNLREQAVARERSAQQLANAGDAILKHDEEIQSLKADSQGLQTMLEDARREGHQNRDNLARADSILSNLEKASEQADLLELKAEEALDSHRGQMLDSANSRADARERHARQQAMLTQAQARLGEVLNQESGLREALLESAEQETQAGEKLEATTLAVKALMDELDTARAAQLDKREKADRASEELAIAGQVFLRDKARHAAMDELAKANEGYYQPVRQALQHSRNNDKVYGAIAQLMEVPGELETAIEMVLGGSLQHIVVENEETARDLIQYLREQRYGRTTFLPLSAVKGRVLSQQERRVLSLPGCLGLASEMVSYQERFRGVMESLLGRTVVARDLDAAIGIARAGNHAFHVVTLQGDVTRAGGAMTGGSVQSRTVSLLGRERELKELGDALNQQALALQTLEKQSQALAQAANADDEGLLFLSERVKDEEIGIAREEEQHKRAQERLAQAQAQLDQALQAASHLKEMIQDLQSDLQAADDASRQVEQDREALANQENTLKEALAKAKVQALEARDALDKQREARSQLAHQLDLVSRDQNRAKKDLESLENKRERLQTARTALVVKQEKEQAALLKTDQVLETLNQEVLSLRTQSAQAEARRRDLAAHQRQLMEASEQAHRRHSEDSQRYNKGELSLGRLEDELSSLSATLWNTHELTYALAEAFRENGKVELPAMEREAGDIRKAIKDLGSINILALDEYAGTKARHDDLSAQRDDAAQAREDLLGLIKRLQGQMEKQFVREFALLNTYFEETFKRLFNGGQAGLSLSDPAAPLDCEIQIKAQPPGKKLQLLSLLSGGERTLTAIAILFAMLKLKPTPFCLLDEIEAALDDANIDSFADYLAEYKKGTQFIVITHRKGTMERCDTLYGVTMREKGVSEMISVNLQEYTA